MQFNSRTAPPTTRTRGSLLSRRVIFAIFLFFTAAAAFDGYYNKVGFLEDTGYRGFVEVVEGTGYRPYVYRQLIPTVANWADRIAPKSLKVKLASIHGDFVTGVYAALFHSSARFRSTVALNPVYSFRYLVFYLEVLLFAEIAAFLLYLVCRAFEYSPQVSVIASALLILLIPYFQIRGGGFYADFPELAFFALAVLIARRFHWLWLVPVAFLGTFNKESFLLMLIALWPILRERFGNMRAALQVAVTGMVGTPVYLWLRYHFRNNPGGSLEIHFADQIIYFTDPHFWFMKLGLAYGAFVPEMLTVLPMALLVWITLRGWKGLPGSIRLHALMGLVMIVPLFLAFSVPGEVRDCAILYIALLLLIAANLTEAGEGSPVQGPLIAAEPKAEQLVG